MEISIYLLFLCLFGKKESSYKPPPFGKAEDIYKVSLVVYYMLQLKGKANFSKKITFLGEEFVSFHVLIGLPKISHIILEP